MPVSGKSWKTNLPPEARSFPADAEQSKLAWKEIVRAIYIRYPNVRIIYSSTKGNDVHVRISNGKPRICGRSHRTVQSRCRMGCEMGHSGPDQRRCGPQLRSCPGTGQSALAVMRAVLLELSRRHAPESRL